MTAGAIAAPLAFIQELFQHDNASLPVQLGLGPALFAVIGGAAAVKVGMKMSAA